MQNLAPQDGELFLFKAFYQPAEAEQILINLLQNLQWQEESIVVVGKRIKVPRLIAWYGDADAVYEYSSVCHQPLPWTTELLAIKAKIEQQCHADFNSVLANLYRDGTDSMGWHADKEKQLGKNPCIASLSFGQPRLFKLRHNKTKQVLDIILQQGDLLLMTGALQHHWRHCLPKTRRRMQSRVNLTFRKII
jgi:alkylated DNA repair dioxygenase AlkB